MQSVSPDVSLSANSISVSANVETGLSLRFYAGLKGTSCVSKLRQCDTDAHGRGTQMHDAWLCSR